MEQNTSSGFGQVNMQNVDSASADIPPQNPQTQNSSQPEHVKSGVIKKFFSKKPFLLLTVFAVFLVFIAVLVNSSGGMKLLSKLGVLNALKKTGMLRADENDFFNALETQDLVYDYNRDGTVTGDDYAFVVPTVPAQAVAASSVDSSTTNTDAMGEADLPSVKGISSNTFDGAATVSYDFDLPTGTAGLTPSLSLFYSSSNVDDMQTGTHTELRGAVEHGYQNQAGQFGLGWSLSGIGYISRDFNDTIKNEFDDKFILTFQGGSANLTKESGDETYSVWRTSPNLKVKVERYGKCFTDTSVNNNGVTGSKVICRYSWVATDGGGTKYYFGSFGTVSRDAWAKDRDPEARYIPGNGSWYPLYERSGDEFYGTRPWLVYQEEITPSVYRVRSITYKWMISKVESKFDSTTNNVEINYTHKLETKKVGTSDYYYVANSTPYKITYGQNEVEFVTEPRKDFYIHQNLKNPAQGVRSNSRISKIIVKSLGKIRDVYKLSYDYGWKPTDHTPVPPSVESNSFPAFTNPQPTPTPTIQPNVNDYDCEPEVINNVPEVIPGKTIHSLLTKITRYSDDPDANSSAKRLPSSTYSYGANCNGFCGGCPLKAYVAEGDFSQGAVSNAQTANDFFLQSAENGTGGKITFEYYQDASGNNAIPVKYCDSNNFDEFSCSPCRTDLKLNTQRHRVAAEVVDDGIGNFVRSEFRYTGENANVGLAYVEKYFQDWCSNSSSPDKLKLTCGGSSSDYDSQDMVGYEFLGYPEVETLTYQKNSATALAAKSKVYYNQVFSSAYCRKPSPLKGTAARVITYDVNDPGKFTENISKYKVRFGAMFGAVTDYDEGSIGSQCDSYDPKTSVTTLLPSEEVSKIYIGGHPVLCTKSTTGYANLDGSVDPYAMAHTKVSWGKVDCGKTENDLSEDTPVYSMTDYTQGRNDTLWRTPLVKESWVSDSANGQKYNNSRNYYDSLSLGQIGTYGNLTRSETLMGGSVYAASTNVFDSNYPWLVARTTDPLGRQTSMEYDAVFHMFPTRITNALNQSVRTEYDFNTTDATHPNYGGNRGTAIKVFDSNNAQNTNVYDKFGRLISVYLPGKVPSSNTLSNSFVKYYYFNADDISACNAENNCMSDLGKPTGESGKNKPKMVIVRGTRFVDSPNPGKMNMSYSYYNGLGQLVQTRNTWYDGSFSSAGLAVAGEESLRDIITSSSYNALGNVEYQSMPYTAAPFVFDSGPSGFDTRNFITDSGIKKSRSYFDGLGRVYRSDSPDGSYITTVYEDLNNPLRTKVRNKNCTDSLLTTLCTENITEKDAFGRTVLGESYSTQNNVSYTTKFENHPVLGSVVKTIDTLGNKVSQIEYDTLGRKTAMWDIDMSPSMSGTNNSWRYEYDQMGNLVRQTDPKNQVSTLTYDSLNRITRKTVNGSNIQVSTYDNCPGGAGRLCQVGSYDPSTSQLIQQKAYEYDNRGRVIKDTTTLSNMPNPVVSGVAFTSEFTYDQGGRVLTEKLPSSAALSLPAETLILTYNGPYLASYGNTSDAQAYLKNSKYNKYGQLVYQLLGDNTRDEYSFDENNMRLSSIGVNGSAGSLMSLAYRYDPNGNITGISDLINTNMTDPNSMNQNFTYDALSRLTSATGAYDASYSYDAIGNIVKKVEGGTGLLLSYGNLTSGFYHRPQSTQMTDSVLGTTTTDTFVYDEVGNMTTSGDSLYRYDTNNKMYEAVVYPQTSPAATSPAGLAGDANGDRVVNSADYDIWKVNYGRAANVDVSSGDFNTDGRVDGVDYDIWRSNFGRTSSSTSTPTPTVAGPTNTSTPTTAVTITPTPTVATVTSTPTPTAAGNSAPVINTNLLVNAIVGTAYSREIIATDVNTTNNLSMTISNLPAGLTYGNCTQAVVSGVGKQIACRITGTPTTAGTRTLSVSVTDGIATTYKSINLTVQ